MNNQITANDRQCDNIMWCPYHKRTIKIEGHYGVMVPSDIPSGYRDNLPNTQMPLSLPNGGIFRGPQSNRPWANTPVPATATYHTTELLRSANPPEEAMKQLQASRIGNSYVANPHAKWFNPTESPNGTYRILGIEN